MRALLLAALLALPSPAPAGPVPAPLAFWAMQEPAGAPRVSAGRGARFAYALGDGNASQPVARADGGVFGPYSARFPAAGGNDSQRLYVARAAAPALTSAIAGAGARVSVVAWLRRGAADAAGGSFVAGVWDEFAAARQYALFLDLPTTCASPNFHAGLVSHVSPTGGPTPGSRYCTTAACDTPPLPADAWHCLASVYNGSHILALTNATLHADGAHNPFALAGGIYSPEAAGREGAEFGVGANYVNMTVGSPPVLANRFQGDLGGLAVFDAALDAAGVAEVCAWAEGF